MRIAIDISQINRDNAGINHYLRELLNEYAKVTEHEFVLCARTEQDIPVDLPAHFSSCIIPPVSKWLGGGFAWYWKLARRLRELDVDCLLEVTINTAALFFPRTAVLVMDLAPLTHPEQSDAGTRRRYCFFLWIVRRKAWKILALSASTRAEFLHYFPDYHSEIVVTEAGLNAWVGQELSVEENTKFLSKYQLPSGYLLAVSTLQPRKNYIGMLQAFAQLGHEFDEVQFAIVGKQGWYFEEILEEVERLGLTGRVKFLGPIPEPELPYAYANAQAFIMMSFAEGFGIPVIEARAAGLPVLISDIAPFRELKLQSVAVSYADPSNVRDIAEKLPLLLTADKLSPAPEFLSYYSWQQVSQRILKIIKN